MHADTSQKEIVNLTIKARQELEHSLFNDEEIEEFLIAFFPLVHRQLSRGMTRTEKFNILLERAEPLEIYSAIRCHRKNQTLKPRSRNWWDQIKNMAVGAFLYDIGKNFLSWIKNSIDRIFANTHMLKPTYATVTTATTILILYYYIDKRHFTSEKPISNRSTCSLESGSINPKDIDMGSIAIKNNLLQIADNRSYAKESQPVDNGSHSAALVIRKSQVEKHSARPKNPPKASLTPEPIFNREDSGTVTVTEGKTKPEVSLTQQQRIETVDADANPELTNSNHEEKQKLIAKNRKNNIELCIASSIVGGSVGKYPFSKISVNEIISFVSDSFKEHDVIFIEKCKGPSYTYSAMLSINIGFSQEKSLGSNLEGTLQCEVTLNLKNNKTGSTQNFKKKDVFGPILQTEKSIVLSPCRGAVTELFIDTNIDDFLEKS